MMFGNFIVDDFENNDCFNPKARDNCCGPFIDLKNELQSHDIVLNTPDLNKNNKIGFEIHIDKQKFNSSKIPTFLFLWETTNVKKKNKDVDKKKYNKVFTWDDDLVAAKEYNKFNLPVANNNIYSKPGFKERIGFCCSISGNKVPEKFLLKDLYKERIKLYKWFEKNAPFDFSLYGRGWDGPIKNRLYKNGFLFAISNKLNYKPNKFSKIYKGPIESKSYVLQKYKYCICYENVACLNGYITEKIFDSMFSGSVPIYWGANNISQYIPKECFIDRRNFADDNALYEFLKSIDEQKYISYQKAANDFLEANAFNKFSSEYFAKTIAYEIVTNINDNR